MATVIRPSQGLALVLVGSAILGACGQGATYVSALSDLCPTLNSDTLSHEPGSDNPVNVQTLSQEFVDYQNAATAVDTAWFAWSLFPAPSGPAADQDAALRTVLAPFFVYPSPLNANGYLNLLSVDAYTDCVRLLTMVQDGALPS